ncbi:hypothetical protein [Nocardioides sp.]|uniref:hypothetical protein n=1 Tax=Nocardioides sp. TaxID=35761 RepID=UPI0026383BA3|nr:hypothetical protein [Nocardioides sp.]
MRRFHRNTVAAVAAAVLMLGAAACGGEDDPKGGDGNSPSPTTSTAPTEDASEASDEWKSKYTKAQLTSYEDALARWNEYEQRSAPLWARGKATEAAAKLFKSYFPSPFWQSQYRRLASYEQVDVKIEGTPGIYWSKAKSISDNGLSVEIQQCVDNTQIKVTQRGKPAKPVRAQQKPNLRIISLSKPEGHDWLIYGIKDASSGKPKPCEP